MVKDPREEAFATEVDWHRRLRHKGKDGAIEGELYNIILMLLHEEEWRGVFRKNEFTQDIEIAEKPPYLKGQCGLLREHDVSMTQAWLQEHRSIQRLARTTVEDAIKVVAELNKYHPVREYLESLEWDGTSRVDHLLSAWLGAFPIARGRSDDDERYLERVSAIFMLQAVARIFEPGCKADYVLILEGEEGIGKSTFADLMGFEWSMDTPIAIGDKDGYQAIQGKWLIEIPELAGMGKAGSERLRAFFSSRSDRFRVSYGRHTEDFPRQCVFVGTTNLTEYLEDDHNRRIMPVYCTKIDIEGEGGLREEREQLWAEAVHRYRAGETYYPTQEDLQLFKPYQGMRQVQDVYQAMIEQYLDGPEFRAEDATVTMLEIVEDGLKLKPQQLHDRTLTTRIGRILYSLGWQKKQSTTRKERSMNGRHYYARRKD